MSESSVSTPSTGTNGATATSPARPSLADLQKYRPKASTAAVHEEVIRSLSEVVTEAADNAAGFARLASLYDRDAGTAIRYGHVVDATECLEIAMTHLGQLKAALNHRLRLEDEQHTGETPY